MAEKREVLMKKRYIPSISLMIVALTALVVLTQPVVPAQAGPGAMPQRQAGDDISAQGALDYLSIAGVTFVPETSSTAFAQKAGGGTSVTGGRRYLHALVILPQGSEICGIRFYYYDNHSPGWMEAALYRNNGDGTRTQLVQVDSPSGVVGGTHYDSDYQEFSPYETVDNSLYNYELEVYWSVGSNDLRLMGIRVFYEHPD